MKRTNILGKPLLYRVGQLSVDDTQNVRDGEDDFSTSGSSGGGFTASNILPPVTPDPVYDVIITPSVITYDTTNNSAGNNNTSNSDASTQPTSSNTATDLNSDIPLTPVNTTPTTETGTTAKINKNWWWALAAGALAYKLARHKVL